MRFGSVCSGIEAASVAWHPLGWEAAFVSEIESFPCAVLAHHYPDVPNFGDMTKFKEWPDAAIDVLVGGTPCQSFSVAGLRAGLDDPRGNLMLTFGAVAARYRPEWVVWENVPGVLSSNGGRDFGTFLGLLGQLGYGFAYRVLDAQFVRVDGLERAVPQRRRRVFVVGCLGGWRRAAAVLFERQSLRGDPAPRREAWKGPAAGVIKGAAIGRKPSAGPQFGDAITDGSCYTLTTNEVHCVAGTINTRTSISTGAQDAYSGHLIPERARALTTSNQRIDAETETLLVTHALTGEGFDASEDGTGRGTPLVPVGYTLHGSDGTVSTATRDDLAQCLRARAPGNIDNSSTTVALHPIAFDTTQITSATNRSNPQAGDPCHPLAAGAHAPAIASRMQVRRLTPRECARLQGFPEVKKQAIILMCCSDHQKNLALAETRNLRSQRPASDAVVKASRRSARHVGQCSRINLLGHDWPVALSVQVDCVRREVRILSQGRLLWSASTAGRQSSSPLRMPVEDFVRLAAPTMGCLVPTMQSGREGVTHPSMCLGSGFGLAALSESEMGELANDAERLRREAGAFMTSITSPVLPSSPSYEQTIQTWSCFVAAAIASFIPEQIRSAGSFALSVEATTEYLDIQFRGKPASDAVKYKALGNSMAVNCMRWIGTRIQVVDAIEKAKAAA